MKALPFLVSLVLAGSISWVNAAKSSALPKPWKHKDVGAVSVKGSAKMEGDVFVLQGSLDIWGRQDGCYFAWQPLQGDGVIIARVLSVENTQYHAKGGLAIRESLKAGSRHATLIVTPTDGSQFLSRIAEDSITTSLKTALHKGTMPYWLKLERRGNQFLGYESLDGEKWIRTGIVAIDLPEKVYIGLVASSHQPDQLCEVRIDQVTLQAKSN